MGAKLSDDVCKNLGDLTQQTASLFKGRLPNAELVADLQQDVSLSVISVLKSKNIDDIQGYLYRTARNLVVDFQRRQSRAERFVESIDTTRSGVDETTPLQILLLEEKIQHLHSAIRELPPRCREVLLLRHFDRLSNTQIARELGISTSMVEKHLLKAFKHCANRLRDLYP